MDIKKYIERINFKGEISTNLNCLRELHRCHVMSVPFESMDIFLSRRIKLDQRSLFEKVVKQERGGFCYELNYLFHSLLTQLGFECSMVSSRIFDNESIGPEFDHMSIVVKLEEDWLVDVGYGDLFIEPLKIYSNSIQGDYFKEYMIEQLEDKEFVLSESLKNKQDFRKRYIFDLEPRTIDEFTNQCYYKQTSPDSYFVKNMICTIPTKNGRKTIFNDRFKIRSNGKVQEISINDNDSLIEVLREEFNISIPNSEYKEKSIALVKY